MKNGDKVSDEKIMDLIDKGKDAREIMTALGFKHKWSLQNRVARIIAAQKKFIEVPGLYGASTGGFGEKRDPKIGKKGLLTISKAWLDDSGFEEGDTFKVKFEKTKIVLTKK